MASAGVMPSASSIFSAYASASATIMLCRTMFNQIVPHHLQQYVLSKIRHFFKVRSTMFALIIEENNGMTRNQLYEASETFLVTKISPNAERLKVSKNPKQKNIDIKFAQSEKIVDIFQGIELEWKFVCEELQNSRRVMGEDNNFSWESQKRYFEVRFHKKHKDTILGSYLSFVLDKAEAIRNENKFVRLHTLGQSPSYGSVIWDFIYLEHPSTFDNIAMEPDLKKEIMDDLAMFLERKEFYKKVGKAWKRGYLLHGPPGTGKSSLIAAMANHVKFDIYDLQLMNIKRDSDLRKLLLATANRSILVIEDIDCSANLPDRDMKSASPCDPQFTLSGLLNFIDGLWSSCGDERIIIFTTNNKDKLDPALLRPGRMDMHIPMSYLTANGFKVLASNYLGLNGRHWRFGEIEQLIESTKVTPAEVAEELMKKKDADQSLEGLVNFLKRKKIESSETKKEGTDGTEIQDSKRLKTDE